MINMTYLILYLISFRIFVIGAMAREEEGGRIRERDIIDSSEQDSGIGQVIIKNVLIDF